MTTRPKPGDSRRPYQRVLSTINLNTGHDQPVLIAAHTLWAIVGHGSMSRSDARTALQAARENSAVIRWRDGAGEIRYGLTSEGVDELPDTELPIYSAEDVDALQDVIKTEASRPDGEMKQSIIGWANQHLQSVREAENDE